MDSVSSSPGKLPSNNSTRRKGDIGLESEGPESPKATSPPPLGSSLTTSEYLVAAIYPATLILASTFYLLSPSPSTNESYFSKKSNLFNVVFVKYGWFWTTLAFFIHLSRLCASSKPKAALRWSLATIWWIVVTQWFFGPPLMDRAFLVTGGACETLDRVGSEALDMGMSKGKLLLTSTACKLQGGQWRGGHDLSGHVFLLTHASLFLWSELLPFLKAGIWGGTENAAMYGVLGIWWWMLLMTGIYFHTWREKTTGLIVAAMQWVVFYGWALKRLPKVRIVLGVPGI